MKATIFFANQNGVKIEEQTYECETLPRIGETFISAPGVTPEGTPEVPLGGTPVLWQVYDLQYMLTNQGTLGLPTIYAQPKPNPK